MEPQLITKLGSSHLAENLLPLVRRLRGGKSKVPNRMKKEKNEQGVLIAGQMIDPSIRPSYLCHSEIGAIEGVKGV
jgi:hypothetical protein